MALATRLLQVVRDVAAELEVSAEVLATRKDVEAIAFGSGAPDGSPLMRGWRRDVVGEKLLAALLAPVPRPRVTTRDRARRKAIDPGPFPERVSAFPSSGKVPDRSPDVRRR